MSDKLENDALNGEYIVERNALSDGNRVDKLVFAKYKEYAKSIIEDRAIPDVRDGFKPVQRRIIYALHVLNISRFIKSSRIVGDVNGKYHPHGDAAVYETLVRLVKDIVNNYPLLDGQGNFGSSEYEAAAQRYTEAKMSAYAKEFFYYFDEKFSEIQPNYDGSLVEPVAFIPRVPNLLVNGCHGIAVGLRTSIPPHNLNELLRALLMVLNDKNITLNEVMDVLKGPDLPTGGSISSYSSIYKFYETGEGSIEITARYNIEGNKIVFYEIPYQTNKSELVKEISTLADNDDILGVKSVRDGSDKDGIRIVVEMSNGYDLDVVANKIYQKTRMKYRMSLAFFAIDHNKKPRLYTLMDYLKNTIDYREDALFRKFMYLLELRKKRLHLVVGLYVALGSIDFVIDVARNSRSSDDAARELLNHKWKCDDQLLAFLGSVGIVPQNNDYYLSEEQVTSILGMKLRFLSISDRESITKETIELKDEINEYNLILSSREKRYAMLREEYEKMLNIYSKARKSEILSEEFSISDLSLVNPRAVVLICSHREYLQRIDVKMYRLQNRGGQGRNSTDAKLSLSCSTRDKVLFFMKSGKVFSRYVYEIPEGRHGSNGRAIVNFLPVSSDDSLVCMFAYDSQGAFPGHLNVLFVFSDGHVRKNLMSEFDNIRSNGKIYIKFIDPNIHLINVLFGEDDQFLFIAKHFGEAVRIPISSFRVMKSRNSTGIIGCKLRKKDGKKDYVVTALVVNEEEKILTLTEKGYLKISKVGNYKPTNRGVYGVRNIGKSIKNIGKVVACIVIGSKTKEIIIGMSNGKVIRQDISSIRTSIRSSVGVKAVNLNSDGDSCVDSVVKYVVGVEDENENK